jgi:hypothetical protein
LCHLVVAEGNGTKAMPRLTHSCRTGKDVRFSPLSKELASDAINPSPSPVIGIGVRHLRYLYPFGGPGRL